MRNPERTPKRDLIQIVVLWAIAYGVFGALTLDAISKGKSAVLCFAVFFSLTPIVGVAGYLTLRDTYRRVDNEDASLRTSIAILAGAALSWLVAHLIAGVWLG